MFATGVKIKATGELKLNDSPAGCSVLKVHLTPNFYFAEMKLCNIHIKNLIILSVSGVFKGFKNLQKVAEICYQLVHNRASRGLALFLI